ncbi:cyclic AMP-dependent transcription factor ATF-4 [Choloepus didactylus]|uniref:cyclic AMP-dependent transcription factor ATF-4 n=1 Tax=Choloepus didactylus TaxID=27675 RepID=UPI00189C83A8|nr:cyclic AMP-dependent transcription factor ATF-4 [Choloepus didactylus]
MTESSFLSSEVLAGHLMSPFDQSGLGAEDSLGLLDDYLEVAKHFKPHGFFGDKAKAGSSEWLAVDGLVSASDNGKEDAFSGTDWMVEKMDLKEFDFDALFSLSDLETMPEELLATLDDTCDLFEPLVQDKEPPQTGNPIGCVPESLSETNQITSFTFLHTPSHSLGTLSSTPDHSFSLELGSEVDISEGERRLDSGYGPAIPQCIKEEDAPSDNDSGICMSPESYLGSPKHSPSSSGGPPSGSLQSHSTHCGCTRPKPYDPPGEKVAAAKVKGEKLDKKLKKMEQNKTAATRYRQKKRAEQEALTGECKELEKKNEALKERADALAKEIQYLKDLIEEVRKARGKKRVP